MSIPFALSFVGGLGQILELEVVARAAGGYNDVNAITGQVTRNVVPSNNNVQKISSNFKSSIKATDYFFLDTHQFLVAREDLGIVTFDLNLNGSAQRSTSIRGGWVQRWRLIDPAVYLMDLHMRKLDAVAKLSNS
jgi:hypothetical protein